MCVLIVVVIITLSRQVEKKNNPADKIKKQSSK